MQNNIITIPERCQILGKRKLLRDFPNPQELKDGNYGGEWFNPITQIFINHNSCEMSNLMKPLIA
jgi:hypothetical protein